MIFVDGRQIGKARQEGSHGKLRNLQDETKESKRETNVVEEPQLSSSNIRKSCYPPAPHELVNLRTRLPMVGKFLVDAWRCCGGSTEEHSISVHSVSNSFLS